MDPLEQAALSGKLFETPHPTSPTRTASTPSPTPSSPTSPSSPTHSSPPGSPTPLPNSNLQNPSSQAQTGPKGVISDQRARDRLSKLQRENDIREFRYRQERAAILGLTVHEEEELRRRDERGKVKGEGKDGKARGRGDREGEGDVGDGLGEWRRRRLEELENGGSEGWKKGGLKEVGREGFVSAVEKRGWVVVLIYEPDIPRCNALLASTLSLSLSLLSNVNPFTPNTHIQVYRARASNLAFSLLPTLPREQGEDEDEDGDAEGGGRPDPDVLPTLLAYRDGELEKTWVRVDWDVGEDGVEGLLRREGILGGGFGDLEIRDENESDDDD